MCTTTASNLSDLRENKTYLAYDGLSWATVGKKQKRQVTLLQPRGGVGGVCHMNGTYKIAISDVERFWL